MRARNERKVRCFGFILFQVEPVYLNGHGDRCTTDKFWRCMKISHHIIHAGRGPETPAV